MNRSCDLLWAFESGWDQPNISFWEPLIQKVSFETLTAGGRIIKTQLRGANGGSGEGRGPSQTKRWDGRAGWARQSVSDAAATAACVVEGDIANPKADAAFCVRAASVAAGAGVAVGVLVRGRK